MNTLYKEYPNEFRSYSMAKHRCSVTGGDFYKNYAGRGIKFLFHNFREFLEHLGVRPSLEHQLDRINNDGHYEPGNVRWATRLEQSLNRRTNRYIEHNGERLTVSQWAAKIGIPQNDLYNRLNVLGWCETCTITLPTRGRCLHKNRQTQKGETLYGTT